MNEDGKYIRELINNGTESDIASIERVLDLIYCWRVTHQNQNTIREQLLECVDVLNEVYDMQMKALLDQPEMKVYCENYLICDDS